jgi:hypothetical protein
MQIQEFKGKKWIIGLDWEHLPGEASFKQEAKEIAEKQHCSYGILVDYDQQSAIGLAKKDSKLPSASLYLSLANQEVRNASSNLDNYPDWIVVDEVGDEKYWMAVIRDGIPSPGYDLVMDITSIKEKITDLMINDTYRFFSPCGEIKAIFDDMKFVEEADVNKLTENVSTKIKFTKLRGIPNSVVIAGIVGIILIGAGMGLSQFIEGRSLREKALAIKHQQEEEAIRQQQEYERNMQTYNQARDQARLDAIHSVMLGLSGRAAPLLSQWYNLIGDIPTGTHGWTLDSAECSLNMDVPGGKNGCDIHFKRTGLSTNRMFLQDYPDGTINGDDAVISRPLPITDDELNHVGEQDLAKLPNSKNWGFDMLSQLQLLKIAEINHEIKASDEIFYTEPGKPLSPDEVKSGLKPRQPVQVSLNVAKGSVIVTSKNFDLLRELADNVDFYSVGLRNATFKFGDVGDIDWTVNLNYYVQTGTGGITASDSGKLSSSALPVNPGLNPADNGAPPGVAGGPSVLPTAKGLY